MNNKKKICVFGNGKMGLPISVAFADKGFDVIGYDINKELVDEINKGKTNLEEPGLKEKLEIVTKNGSLKATSDAETAIKDSDMIIVIVPLFLNDKKKPDYSIVKDASETISEYLSKDKIVVFETTLPIGTTRNIIKPILEKSGLKCGEDFGLAYSPERVMSGEFFKRMDSWSKIIGSFDKETSDVLADVYSEIYKSGVTVVDNPETAEMIKIASSLYRDVNIAFSNEIAKICDEYKIDVLKVVETVNQVPEKRMLYPGIGVGGHCIPVYPYFVIDHVRSDIPVIMNSRLTNESMPKYSIGLLEKELNKDGEHLKEKNVLILGLAFRPWVKETYFSPTFDLINELEKKDNEIHIYDPVFSEEEIKNITKKKTGSYEDLVKKADIIIIATGYEEFRNVGELKKDVCIVMDGRNITEYKGIGR